MGPTKIQPFIKKPSLNINRQIKSQYHHQTRPHNTHSYTLPDAAAFISFSSSVEKKKTNLESRV